MARLCLKTRTGSTTVLRWLAFFSLCSCVLSQVEGISVDVLVASPPAPDQEGWLHIEAVELLPCPATAHALPSRTPSLASAMQASAELVRSLGPGRAHADHGTAPGTRLERPGQVALFRGAQWLGTLAPEFDSYCQLSVMVAPIPGGPVPDRDPGTGAPQLEGFSLQQSRHIRGESDSLNSFATGVWTLELPRPLTLTSDARQATVTIHLAPSWPEVDDAVPASRVPASPVPASPVPVPAATARGFVAFEALKRSAYLDLKDHKL